MKGCMSRNRTLAQLVAILACNAIVANWCESDLKISFFMQTGMLTFWQSHGYVCLYKQTIVSNVK